MGAVTFRPVGYGNGYGNGYGYGDGYGYGYGNGKKAIVVWSNSPSDDIRSIVEAALVEAQL